MQNQTLSLLWQPTKEGIRLLKVYGYDTSLVLPEYINNIPVTEIGPYCFADRFPSASEDLYLDQDSITAEELKKRADGQLLPPAAAGRALEMVRLPSKVKVIHNGAFYNCRSLRSLSTGPLIRGIGSDVFTNDTRLKLLTIRSSEKDKTGLPLLLERLTDDMTVQFCTEKEISAVLFFPEYYEWLDEVTPAHLFTRSVHGEGFRMRKAFSQGKIDFLRYDGCFSSAIHEESVSSLLMTSLCRLRYPVSLLKDAESLYRDTVQTHLKEAFLMALTQKDASLLNYLTRDFSPDATLLDEIRNRTIEKEWGEGAAIIIKAKQKQKKDDLYDLDW